MIFSAKVGCKHRKTSQLAVFGSEGSAMEVDVTLCANGNEAIVEELLTDLRTFRDTIKDFDQYIREEFNEKEHYLEYATYLYEEADRELTEEEMNKLLTPQSIDVKGNSGYTFWLYFPDDIAKAGFKVRISLNDFTIESEILN